MYGPRCGDFRNPKFIARVSSQCVFRHQLLRYLSCKGLIDATLDVDIGKFIELKSRVLAQLLAFAREIGLLGICLRMNRNVFAGGHRHRASH